MAARRPGPRPKLLAEPARESRAGASAFMSGASISARSTTCSPRTTSMRLAYVGRAELSFDLETTSTALGSRANVSSVFDDRRLDARGVSLLTAVATSPGAAAPQGSTRLAGAANRGIAWHSCGKRLQCRRCTRRPQRTRFASRDATSVDACISSRSEQLVVATGGPASRGTRVQPSGPRWLQFPGGATG